MNSVPAMKKILPGSKIGILGSGQLGRMMTVAAKQMGYRVHVFSSAADSPTGQLADMEVVGQLDDLDAISRFAQGVDVMTVETENIPVDTLATAAEFCPAFPGKDALRVCQNRNFEKQFLRENGIPTCDFQTVHSVEELKAACERLMPSILKTTQGGYDGKGQAVIRSTEDVESAWSEMKGGEAILEQMIDFDFEFSIVGARSSTGEVTAYPSIRNEHSGGILDISTSPSGLSEEAEAEGREIVFKIMNELNSVGVLTVEFFYRRGDVLVNEIAPRPHNSGHATIEGNWTSQFEQHIRAVCGISLGAVDLICTVAMANVMGDIWNDGTPDWAEMLNDPRTKLHLYGKEAAKIGRKMGHLTAVADTVEQARNLVVEARKRMK
ncbi:MAG: 5-(carboxyamino)imidazole ribonucleotide synthase [Planctomycetota bacterium]